MTTKKRKIAVGIFAAASLGLLALVLVVFGGVRLLSQRDDYYITYEQSVMGLEVGATVSFNGIKVGRVGKVASDPQNLERVRVTIEVDADAPVRADTRAELKMAGITGLKAIDLRGGTASAPRLPAGSTIVAGETTLDKLEKQAKTLVDQTEELMKSARSLMASAQTVMASTGTMMQSANTVAENLGKTTASLNMMVEENRSALHASILAVCEATRSTKKLLDGQVADLLGSANTVVTDLGRMLRSNQEQLHAALGDIRTASRNFKDFSREVRQKPSRLLFSGNASERKLP